MMFFLSIDAISNGWLVDVLADGSGQKYFQDADAVGRGIARAIQEASDEEESVSGPVDPMTIERFQNLMSSQRDSSDENLATYARNAGFTIGSDGSMHDRDGSVIPRTKNPSYTIDDHGAVIPKAPTDAEQVAAILR